MAHRRRSSWPRRFLSLLVLAGFGGAATVGVIATRDYIRGDDVVLDVVNATSTETPSTLPLDANTVERESPLWITIPTLELQTPVRAVGLEETGELEVPDATEVGWYQYGSAPGLPGATVLAAHVSWNGDIGPFHRLGDLEPGETVEVNEADGSTRTYEVIERAVYDKDSLPIDLIWRTTGDETLVLITCGGSYNPEIRRFRQNIVVYAVPVADA